VPPRGRVGHGRAETQKIGENMDNSEKIKELLFKQVERPKGLVSFKAVNVFDNRYRINLWVQREEDGLTKTKIGASYFAVLDGDELRLRA